VQASAFWQWSNFAEQHVPAARRPLRVNLDETAVCLSQACRKGNVLISNIMNAVQHAPLAARRTYLTHVALICDVADIQPVLPQVLIVNERTVPAERLPAIRAALPANVFVLRQKSAWNNNAVCAWVIRRLGRALAPHAADYQAILFLDTHKTHYSREVLAACRSCGIWPVYVPAKLTWLLQPLDTHAFLLFKLMLQRFCLAARIRLNRVGPLDVDELIQCICSAIREVLQGRTWTHAFEHNGIGLAQAGLSVRVKAALQIDAVPATCDARPNEEQLQRCFPKRTAVKPLANAIWKAYIPKPPAIAKAPCPPTTAAPMCVAPVGVRLGPPARPKPLPPFGLRRSTRLAKAGPPAKSHASHHAAGSAAPSRPGA
jgi:hypothetical protein